jgi:hypothetical protein
LNRFHRGWSALVIVAALPLLVLLCVTLWRAPFPIREVVGLFEDLNDRAPSEFLVPTSAYYRPAYYLTLSGIWHAAPSMARALDAIRLLHIVPLTALVLLCIGYMRPRRAIDAAAATLALAVLYGSPGLLGNLELPLSYTIVGMPIVVMVLALLERERRGWHGPVIVALTLLAVGFKEQGLVLVPLVIVAWWMGAPGVGRGTVASLAGISVAYVLFRIVTRDPTGPQFEQDVGFLFQSLSAGDAEARFGARPWIYAYSSASTIANVLFAEPTDGVFRFVRAMTEGQTQPWHVVYLGSSLALTGVVAWWGTGTLRRAGDARWSSDARLFVGLVVVLAACGALSFNYSRDRLGGMAVPLLALAAFFAVRAAAVRAAAASKSVAMLAALAFVLLAGAWQLRAVYTLEFTRQRTVNSHREWITDLRNRRESFVTRGTYLRMLEALVPQGTDPRGPIHPLGLPRWLTRLLGES